MKTILAFLTALACSTALAEMTLVADESNLHFLSIKGGSVAEIHSFDGLSGTLDEEGTATVQVDLNTVNTGIDIRNQRMRDFLFKVIDFPTAIFTAQVDMAQFESLETGLETSYELAGRLSLHGIAVAVTVPVMAARTADGGLRVHTPAPVVLRAADFGLEGGVEKLRELAALPSIDPVIPVSFSVLFR